MMTVSPLKDYRIAPAQGDHPESVVIFLHGLGDSGSGGLLEIGRIWQPALPRTEFLCPDAPFPFDMAPADFGGRQWFGLRDFSQKEVEEGVANAAPILDDYIDYVLETRKIEPGRLVLVGFSQGTMMSLHVAPRREVPLAGVIGYSGLLTFADKLAVEKKNTPPVLLVHGTADDVVPFPSMAAAQHVLQQNGFAVQTLACPGVGHGIDEAGIETGLGFLLRVLNRKAE